ncbi:MAG: type II secretion system F family protein [Varibaculum sp.]|nr:type II secretion system F family protein [Varibaculum sp.]
MVIAAALLMAGGVAFLWLSLVTDPPVRHPRNRLRKLLETAGLASLSPWQLVAFSSGLAVVSTLLVAGTLGSWPLAGIAAVAAAAAPILAVKNQVKRLSRTRRRLWPELIDTIVSGIRAGMSLPETMVSLVNTGPVETREDFRYLQRMLSTQVPFTEALIRLRARFADPMSDRVLETIALAYRVGGADVTVMLTQLADMTRADLRTRGEMEARQSWTVNSARLAVVAPWIVLAVLSLNSETAGAYTDSAGLLVLFIGVAVSLVSYWIMKAIARLPEPTRVLGGR